MSLHRTPLVGTNETTECTICKNPANQPRRWFKENRPGQIQHGCIAIIHDPYLVLGTADRRWAQARITKMDREAKRGGPRRKSGV